MRPRPAETELGGGEGSSRDSSWREAVAAGGNAGVDSYGHPATAHEVTARAPAAAGAGHRRRPKPQDLGSAEAGGRPRLEHRSLPRVRGLPSMPMIAAPARASPAAAA